MNVALYARVSSEKQAEKDLSLPAQLKALRDYAFRKNWTIVEEFIDEAESARTADRPQFQRMISEAKLKTAPFSVILVWKLNRFARNREDSIIYKSLLRKRGVQVISINEALDEGPTGKLLEGIIESIDEFYSANLSQDTIRGLKENAMRGFWNGGVAPFGYDFDIVKVGTQNKRRLKLNEHDATIIRRIFRLCLDGEGLKDIAKSLNADGYCRRSGKPWSHSSMAYILSNPIYTGSFFWKEGEHNPKAENPLIKIPNTHPAIISEQDFEAARAFIKSRTREFVHPRTVSSNHLLSGLIRCKHCGAMMTVCGAKSNQFHYYTCQTYLKMGKEQCSQKAISAEKFEPFIVQTIKERVFTPENMGKLLLLVNEELEDMDAGFEEKIEMVNEVLSEKLERRRKLYEGIETSVINLSDIAPRLKELNKDISDLEEQKLKLAKQHQEGVTIKITDAQLKPYIDDLRETLMMGSIAERKGFIRSFVKKITVDYPNVELEYSLPLPTKQKDRTSTTEVLSIAQYGVADGI